MSPIFGLAKRGTPITETGSEVAEATPSTWASVDTTGSITSPTAIGAVTTQTTSHSLSQGIVTAIPTHSTSSSTAASSSSGSSHLGLAIALPISLFLAAALIVVLYFRRYQARRAAQRRRLTWSRRMSWVPDTKNKAEFADETEQPDKDFNAANPMSPISTLPPSYGRHQRADSAFA